MKIQNTFLTKFMIMQLTINAFSILFLSALPKNLLINFFVE